METRTAWLLVGALAVCCVGLVLAAVYPFSASKPHAANPADERFTVDDADSYRVTGRLVVDGEVKLGLEGVVTGDGERYQAIEEPGVRSEQYRASPNGPVYERIAVDHDDTGRMRASITADENRQLVREDRTTERAIFVVERSTTERSDEISGSASVFVRSLHVAGYETKENDATDVAVHEPQNGWYDGREPYRITAASGTVRTDADTYAVESATVTWEVTAPAGTYAEYLLSKLTGDAPRTHELSFEFETGASGVDRPTWVDETRTGS